MGIIQHGPLNTDYVWSREEVNAQIDKDLAVLLNRYSDWMVPDLNDNGDLSGKGKKPDYEFVFSCYSFLANRQLLGFYFDVLPVIRCLVLLAMIRYCDEVKEPSTKKCMTNEELVAITAFNTPFLRLLRGIAIMVPELYKIYEKVSSTQPFYSHTIYQRHPTSADLIYKWDEKQIEEMAKEDWCYMQDNSSLYMSLQQIIEAYHHIAANNLFFFYAGTPVRLRTQLLGESYKLPDVDEVCEAMDVQVINPLNFTNNVDTLTLINRCKELGIYITDNESEEDYQETEDNDNEKDKDMSVTEKEKYEYVNHPSHYNNYRMETIDMMLKLWGPENTATFCEMNAYKYRMRLGLKPENPIDQDLEKEKWYLNKAKSIRKEYNLPEPTGKELF